MPKHHEVPFSPDTVHIGFYDPALPPVLRMDSGDRVTIHCLPAGEPADMHPDRSKVFPEQWEVYERCEQGPGPHLMTGPVYVNGAEPGDTLEVRILEYKLNQDWGWNLILPLFGTLAGRFSEPPPIAHPPGSGGDGGRVALGHEDSAQALHGGTGRGPAAVLRPDFQL